MGWGQRFRMQMTPLTLTIRVVWLITCKQCNKQATEPHVHPTSRRNTYTPLLPRQSKNHPRTYCSSPPPQKINK